MVTGRRGWAVLIHKTTQFEQAMLLILVIVT